MMWSGILLGVAPLLSLTFGCGPSGRERFGGADRIATLVVTPRSAELAVGEEVTLSVTAQDASGQTIDDVHLKWSLSVTSPRRYAELRDPLLSKTVTLYGVLSEEPVNLSEESIEVWPYAEDGRERWSTEDTRLAPGRASFRILPGGRPSGLLTLPAQEMTLGTGETKHLTAFVYGGGKRLPRHAIVCQSSQPAVAEVVPPGEALGQSVLVRGVAPGNATLTIGPKDSSLARTIAVTVMKEDPTPLAAAEPLETPKGAALVEPVEMVLDAEGVPVAAFSDRATSSDNGDLFLAVRSATGWDVAQVATYAMRHPDEQPFALGLDPQHRPCLVWSEGGRLIWSHRGQLFWSVFDRRTGQTATEVIDALDPMDLASLGEPSQMVEVARAAGPMRLEFDGEGVPHVAYFRRLSAPPLPKYRGHILMHAWRTDAGWQREAVPLDLLHGAPTADNPRRLRLLDSSSALEILTAVRYAITGGEPPVYDVWGYDLHRLSKTAQGWTREVWPWRVADFNAAGEADQRHLLITGENQDKDLVTWYAAPGTDPLHATKLTGVVNDYDGIDSMVLDTYGRPHAFHKERHLYLAAHGRWKKVSGPSSVSALDADNRVVAFTHTSPAQGPAQLGVKRWPAFDDTRSAAVRVVPPSDSDLGGMQRDFALASFPDGTLGVLVSHFFSAHGNPTFQTTADGATFSAPVAIGHSGVEEVGERVDLAITPQHVFAVYGDRHIYFARSSDRGATFSVPRQLYAADPTDSCRSSVSADASDAVYIQVRCVKGFVSLLRSVDGGESFSSIGLPPIDRPRYLSAIGLTGEGHVVYALLHAATSPPAGTYAVSAWTSDDRGTSWGSPRTLDLAIDSPNRIPEFSVAADGDLYFVALKLEGSLGNWTSRLNLHRLAAGSSTLQTQLLPFTISGSTQLLSGRLLQMPEGRYVAATVETSSAFAPCHSTLVRLEADGITVQRELALEHAVYAGTDLESGQKHLRAARVRGKLVALWLDDRETDTLPLPPSLPVSGNAWWNLYAAPLEE